MNSLQQLKLDIKQCRACEMCNNNPPGTYPVPGEGNENAIIMIIGICPGIEEVYNNMPFIGRSGKLLRKTLAANLIEPKKYYISNIAKCVSRKGNINVDPPQEFQRICYDKWLKNEINIIKPKVIMTLGSIPLKILANIKLNNGIKDAPIKIVSNTHEYWLIPNYHPSYIMQHGRNKFNIFNTQIDLINKVLTSDA